MKNNTTFRTVQTVLTYLIPLFLACLDIPVHAAGIDVKPSAHSTRAPFTAKTTSPSMETLSFLLHGVDVSKWEGTINWDTLKASTDFAIIRSSYGCPDPGQTIAQYTDSQLRRNQSEARRLGMLRG